MRLRRTLSLFFLLSVASTAFAQYSIANIVVENGAPYTDAEVTTSSGLAPGQFLAHDSLANAAQHLVDTGLFADVQVSISGQAKARTVHVALKPTPLANLLPLSFENLVWFTPDELTQGIHARIPLYRGVTAEAGNLQDAIQAAILAMLKEKGVDAKLSSQTVSATAQHPLRVVDVRIERPSIRLGDVHLSVAAPIGVAAKLTPGFQTAVARATRVPFNEGLTGYVTAHLDRIERTVVPSASGYAVTYTTRIETGEAYKISSFTWEPTPIYSAADFARDAKLHPGDLASIYLLNQTDALILAAYLAHGYMDAIVLAPPTLDDSNNTVVYAPTVTPGPVYRVKTVNPLNLAPEAQKEFDANWRMKPGEPYSADYVEQFIQANKALPHLATYTATYQASTDPDTHLVDLTINFISAGH
jgi:outer membrane protein assembly factor BamA